MPYPVTAAPGKYLGMNSYGFKNITLEQFNTLIERLPTTAICSIPTTDL